MPNQLIEIYPVIPASLARLPELSSNLFFSWHRPTRALFEDLEPELWQQVGGNPRLMLRCINQENLDRAAADRIYLERYRQVVESFDAYLSAPQRADEPLVAYFCAEFGFHESFPIYSGGLGILAGDHCKAASDERLNFVAVGLLYTQGYFIQSVDSDGVQHASNAETDPRDLPIEAVRDANGGWMQVTVRIAGRNVVARIWKAQVGRISVYLLDTNCKENASEDREITHRLYGGDAAVRTRLHETAARLGLPPGRIALAWVLARPEVNAQLARLRTGRRCEGLAPPVEKPRPQANGSAWAVCG